MAAELDDLMDDAANAVLALLREFRKDLLAQILATREPLSASYRLLLREVDELIGQYQARLTRTMTEHLTIAANAGDDAALDEIRAVVDVRSYVGVSDTLLRASAEYVASLVQGISNEARAAITREIRLAALGSRTVTELIDAIGRTIESPGVFRNLHARSEAIARTEVARVRAIAHFQQAEELAVRVPGMRKVWEHSSSSPGFTPHQRSMSRPSHVRAWQRTSENPIPIDEDFTLEPGVTARYPHDPRLPASHAVNCRCRVRLVAPDPRG